MSTILSLAPQNVWKHFYSLTQVPRPSGYLKKVQEFLLNFGKSVGVESFQDEAGNIIYRKPSENQSGDKFPSCGREAKNCRSSLLHKTTASTVLSDFLPCNPAFFFSFLFSCPFLYDTSLYHISLSNQQRVFV